jgi:hypothetical protein
MPHLIQPHWSVRHLQKIAVANDHVVAGSGDTIALLTQQDWLVEVAALC